ncbi:hypothetical protein [Chroococcidiopsis sp. CCNUC1]|uniref:hypothetical protein n=1 Tax=Chroococcidiopsis sp. CCNUC1 TaxID=2653189 RepID=UPI0020201715|nr:hypothetical protein [Chroococcidiopsis sp. CCNUC1]URD47718.1 hypothetical protein M5J74_15385 [Chroococcidiopsis sp. CCNUC1]
MLITSVHMREQGVGSRRGGLVKDRADEAIYLGSKPTRTRVGEKRESQSDRELREKI